MGPDCKRNDEALSLLAEGAQAGVGDLHSHLIGCARCREVLRQFEEIRRMASDLSLVSPPPGLHGAVLDAMKRTSTPVLRRRRAPMFLAMAAGLALAIGIVWLSLRPNESVASREVVRGLASETQVTKLIKGLAEPDEDLRAAAAESLGLLGPAARAALPSLERMRQDPSPKVRAAVEQALREID